MMPRRHPRPDSELDAAVGCFVCGFAFTRSLVFPCVAEPSVIEADGVASIWVVRDRPRKNPRDARGEEWVSTAARAAPEALLAAARAGSRGRFKLCHILPDGGDEASLRAEYRRLGCRLMGTEPLLVHDLKRIPRPPRDNDVVRVCEPAINDALTRADRGRRLVTTDLLSSARDAPLRAYAVLDGGRPVGWVRSIHTPTGQWVSNVFVIPTHRRRGIGRALLARMLRDDRLAGATNSTLLASHTGALLYSTLGYRRLGTLYLYLPPTR